MTNATINSSKATAIENILAQYGLNYQVEMALVHYGVEGEEDYREYPKHYVTYQKGTGKPFGVVLGTYKVIQNADAFRFLESVENLQIIKGGPVAAGAVGSGCFLMGEMPEEEVLGDVYIPTFYFSNDHCGRRRFTVSFAPTLKGTQSVLNIGGSSVTASIRHTGAAEDQIKLASGFSKQVGKAMEDFRQLCSEMAEKRINYTQRGELYGNILEANRTKRDSKNFIADLATLKQMEFDPLICNRKDTGYGVLLTVAKFVGEVIETRIKKKDLWYYNHMFKTSPYLHKAVELLKTL